MRSHRGNAGAAATALAALTLPICVPTAGVASIACGIVTIEGIARRLPGRPRALSQRLRVARAGARGC